MTVSIYNGKPNIVTVLGQHFFYSACSHLYVIDVLLDDEFDTYSAGDIQKIIAEETGESDYYVYRKVYSDGGHSTYVEWYVGDAPVDWDAVEKEIDGVLGRVIKKLRGI